MRQSRLPSALSQVMESYPGHAFSWRTAAVGLTSTGGHRVSPGPAGTTVVRLGIGHDGFLVSVAGLLLSRLRRRCLRLEADGLKHHCEREAPGDRGLGPA